MARRRCCKPLTPGSPRSRRCLPTASMPASASPMRLPLWWRSSANCPIRLASSCCRAVGWSSGSLPGSTATAASPRISRPPSPPPRLSSIRLASCCSPGGWLVGVEFKSDSEQRSAPGVASAVRDGQAVARSIDAPPVHAGTRYPKRGADAGGQAGRRCQ